MSSDPLDPYDYRVEVYLREICLLNEKIDEEADNLKRAELYAECFKVWDEVARIREEEFSPVKSVALRKFNCSPQKKVM